METYVDLQGACEAAARFADTLETCALFPREFSSLHSRGIVNQNADSCKCANVNSGTETRPSQRASG
jgi:hypothetical protein